MHLRQSEPQNIITVMQNHYMNVIAGWLHCSPITKSLGPRDPISPGCGLHCLQDRFDVNPSSCACSLVTTRMGADGEFGDGEECEELTGERFVSMRVRLSCFLGKVSRVQDVGMAVHHLCMGPTCLCGGPPISPDVAAGACIPPHPASLVLHKALPSDSPV